MISVVQRVSSATVKIEQQIRANISRGLLLFVGIEEADTAEDIEWLVNKIINLRIFNDSEGVMNISVKEIGGEIIVVSQFTLHASIKKGNRPSYLKAAKPEMAIPVYHMFIESLQKSLGKQIQTGEFGADMKVALVNDGPVTILIDTKNKV